ncbi:hypothetical protein B0E45_01285 [Sinorhizobium sp. A49]|uniref:hypothetical protein n=1 Tax=Sinorhizobium sp. A49 TaxID=1945861 RepID=UPI000987D3A5|nr:hypothetical protein [Sinorhizobium sp. A49]OOG75591.1 hypothetical protein B0E45_01285 [Sinorhizobium sp. A49]
MAPAKKADTIQVGEFYIDRDEDGNARAICRMGLGLAAAPRNEIWARLSVPDDQKKWPEVNERAEFMAAALNNNGVSAISVKPLVWDHYDQNHWISETPLTDYGVNRTTDGKFELNVEGKEYDSLLTAQAAAQADYNLRIRSALATPATSGMPAADSDRAAEALAELERARNELLKRAQTAERNLRDTTAAFARERAEQMKSMKARKADSEKIERLIALIRDGLVERDHGQRMSDAWQSRAQAALSEVIGSQP